MKHPLHTQTHTVVLRMPPRCCIAHIALRVMFSLCCLTQQSWLNVKIHKLGSLHASGDELMTAVTGGPLDPSVFLTYLKNKYTELYKL